MKPLFMFISLLFLAGTLLPLAADAVEAVRHDLKIVLYPDEHRFTAVDAITVPENYPPELTFHLHGGLLPSTKTPGVHITRETGKKETLPPNSYRVSLPSGVPSFVLEYGGNIHHALESYGKEYARGFVQTPGIISEEGVFLAGSSFWYPVFNKGMVTFNLDVELPPGWSAVSQGERTYTLWNDDKTSVRWESPEPQEEIFLVAGRFAEYTQPAGRISAMVFLRTPDAELAGTYLDATARYIAMYEELIGPYPYKKFALVENFWETGFGMPSFTLLGPKVIRFPFIITSSYPHEILHNWWGNSVLPDFAKGNWSEGLTAYLSDHLIKEQQSRGNEYRQTTLQKYRDYVFAGTDFPLTRFRSRHSSPSEAIGYGKALMFFHMLRRSLGDRDFVGGLRDFYRKKRFRHATFDDLKKSFEAASGRKLSIEFDQWITWTGAPEIRLSNAESSAEGDGYTLTIKLEQIQPGDPYHLRIPVAVTLEGIDEAWQTVAVMDKKQIDFTVNTPSRPLRIDIDPEFDLFRRLNRDEIPPAISQALGSKKMLAILPSSADSALLRNYRELAVTLGTSGPEELEVKLDSAVERFPADSAVTIFGWENRFSNDLITLLSKFEVVLKENSVQIGTTDIPHEDHTVVFTPEHPGNKNLALLFIASDPPAAIAGLGRKLPHYHKYSYLGFEGDEPVNIVKGRWTVLDSPMTAFMPGKDGITLRTARAGLAPREPLAELPSLFSTKRMMETVRFLAADELGGRGFGSEELDRAAEYIAQKFKDSGLVPAGDEEGSYYQTWEDRGGETEKRVKLRNVLGVIPGTNPEFSAQSVVVGAHYDHLGLGWPDVREGQRGLVHHGADDNASGVAVLLELARVLSEERKPDRTVMFAAFTGEEAGKRGSRYYIENESRFPSEKCIGMLNLDTVGRLGNRRLLVLGADSAREWVHIFRGAGYVTGVRIETVSGELDSSDQISFQSAGIPAVQLFTGPHLDYHRPTDTADKVDPEGLVKVASVAKEVIEYLAHRKDSMSSEGISGQKPRPDTDRKRNVSLGTVPDFAYSGSGCRLADVVPDSPAEACGLRAGDVIIRLNEIPVGSLKDLSEILKSLNPDDRISITFRRDGKEMTVETEVVER